MSQGVRPVKTPLALGSLSELNTEEALGRGYVYAVGLGEPISPFAKILGSVLPVLLCHYSTHPLILESMVAALGAPNASMDSKNQSREFASGA